MAPKGWPIPRRTGRLTVDRKFNSTPLHSSPLYEEQNEMNNRFYKAAGPKNRKAHILSTDLILSDVS
jgi:hypothetical protein